MKNLLRLLIILLLSAIVVFAGLLYFKNNIFEKKTELTSDVLLEQLTDVQKVITCEGYFTEVMSYKDYYSFDWWPLRKKALIRAKGRASVGYDIDKFVYEVDEQNLRLEIIEIPKPEILSLDHELDYYDISEGSFNQFSESDFNSLNKQAKNLIRSQVEESQLFPFAEEKLNHHLKNITRLAELGGWTIIYPGGQPPV